MTSRRIDVNTQSSEGDELSQYKELMLWVGQTLAGITMEPCKRSYLSGACLHASIEHGMAILALIEMRLPGSALALGRLQLEAWVRGLWLAEGASDGEVDKAGDDKFPKINTMIESLEKPGDDWLSKIKQDSWAGLCSLTHTGFRQIGPRLNLNEKIIGSHFKDDQIRAALSASAVLTILCIAAMARLAKDDPLEIAALERTRAFEYAKR